MIPIKYPLAKQTIEFSEIENLISWLQTNPRLTMADKVKEFEKAWAKFIGTQYAVFVNSGSSANLLATYVAKRRSNSNKIVVPSVGWATTIAPAMQFGMELSMVDADSKTYGLNLDQVDSECNNHNIGTVIGVQVLGVPFSKDILTIKQKHKFILIEDACAALGAKYKDGSKVGTVGDMSTFSFYFGHQLSTIEGGMINTDNSDLYHDLLMLRSHGWIKDLPKKEQKEYYRLYYINPFHEPFTFFLPGFNVRGTDLQAVLGLSQMKKSEWVIKRRYENHLQYATNLKDYFEFQNWGEDYPVSISFGVLAKSQEHRKIIVRALIKNGIETRLFSAGNLGKHPFWRNYPKKIFKGKIADKIHDCGFFLPNYPELIPNEIDEICNIIKEVK